MSHTTQITWTTNIDLNAFTSASGARRLSRVFQYYPTQSKWFPQKLEYVILKLLFVEYYPSFGVERIRRILFLGYRLWFTSSCGFLVLLCKRRDSNERVLSQLSIRLPSPSRFHRTEKSNAVTSSSRLAPNNDTTSLSSSDGFVFPNVLNVHTSIKSQLGY